MTQSPNLNLNKAQERFIQNIIESLENTQIPWNKSWNAGSDIPYNLNSEKPYQGLNQLLLWMEQNKLNTSDNRWMTFNQAKEKGYRIKKGSKSTPVQYFQLYNTRTKKPWDNAYYNSLSPEAKLKEQEYLKIIARTYNVFNGTQIEGIPSLPIKAQIAPEQKLENAEAYLLNLQKNMNIEIQHGQAQAFYAPTEDMVNMPLFETFNSPDNYYHVALHELSHATLHPSRLDRENKRAGFGSYNYSIEELRAEISAFFQSMELGLDAVSLEIDAVSYCQSWAKTIKADPKIVLMAVRDAVKIKDYMVEHGKLAEILDKPKITTTLYHGSMSKFDAFSLDHLGKNGTAQGFGIYLSDNKDLASLYAGEDKGYIYETEVYLENEISLTQRNFSQEELKAMIKKLQETNEILSNYGDIDYSGYDAIFDEALEMLNENENDVDLVNELANLAGNKEDVIDTLYEVGRYTHIIAEEQTLVKDRAYIVLDPNRITITRVSDMSKEHEVKADNPEPIHARATPNSESVNSTPNLEVNIDTLRSSVLITDYAVDVLGFGLTNAGGDKMQVVEHDSCFIYTNKNDFYRFSTHAGGDIYSFVQEFEDVDFKTALEKVKAYYYEYEPVLVEGQAPIPNASQARSLELPPSAPNNNKLLTYLNETRGIDNALIQSALDKKLLYQDKRNNIVFVGYDKKKPAFGTRRSTYSDFKGDVKGTQKNVGFYIDNGSNTLVLAEGPIDALSLLELYEKEGLSVNVLATGGVGNALACWKWNIENRDFNTLQKVVIAFDNDEPGRDASEMLKDYLNHYYNTLEIEERIPEYKDFNQDLMAQKGIAFKYTEPVISEKNVTPTEDIEPVLRNTKPNYISATINDRYCKKTFKSPKQNKTYRSMTFPKGSQYYGYTYVVPTSFFNAHNFRSQEMILTVRDTFDFKLQRGHYDRDAKKYVVDDEKIVNAKDLLRGYQDLEYESESKQFVRLSKRDLDYFKSVAKKNESTAQQKLLEGVDTILDDKNTWLVERHKITELQDVILKQTNEEILDTVERLEKERTGRIGHAKQHAKAHTPSPSPDIGGGLEMNEPELEM